MASMAVYILGSAVVGAGLGVGLMLMSGPRLREPRVREARPATPDVASASRPLPAPLVATRIVSDPLLAQRVAALEESAATQQPLSRAPVPSADEVEAMHDARVAQHGREPLSEGWARTTESVAREDFDYSQDGGYKLMNVDCRSTTCVLELTWQSRALALSGWKDALHKPSRLPCAREIVIPTGAGTEGGEVSAQLILDCSTWVAQGAQL